MPRHAAIGLAFILAGCTGPKSHDCANGDTTWVCPQELACADPPTYCANPLEVGACDNKPDGSPCRTTAVPDGLCVDNACQACSSDIEGCRSVGWVPMTVPSATYKLVYAAGSGDAWAGGTVLAHYDGAHWEPNPTFPATAGGVTGITGTSSAHLFVATDTNSAVYHQVGGAWVDTPTLAPTKAIWAAGADEAFAAGLTGDVEHFAAGAWTQLTGTMTTQTLAAIWGTSATNVYAAGNMGTVAHYDGATWTVSTAGTGALTAVWGSGPNDVYVGGAAGIYHSTDGATWMAQDTTDSITAIWGSSASDIFAGTKATGIVRSDGSGLWVPLVSPPMVTSVAGSGPADAFAAAGSQILHYTGSCWSAPLPAPPASGFASVWAASPSAVFAAGAVGALDRFDGTAWTEQVDGPMNWSGVWARSPTDAYAVGGGAGSTQIDHWNGTAWTSEPNPSNASPVAITGTATTQYAVGNATLMGTAGTWSPIGPALATTEAAIRVAPDDGSIFIAGDQLYVLRGGALDVLLAGNSEVTTWTALWGTSSTDVFAAGIGGEIRHFDGTSWSSPMDTGTTVDLAGLWGTSDDDVFAAGASGTLLHYHAQLWSTVPPPAGVAASFSSVAGAGSTIFVVGPNRTVARLIESAP